MHSLHTTTWRRAAFVLAIGLGAAACSSASPGTAGQADQAAGTSSPTTAGQAEQSGDASSALTTGQADQPVATDASDQPVGTSSPTTEGQADESVRASFVCSTALNPDSTAQGGDGQGDGNSGDSEFGLPEAEIVTRVDAVEQCIAACMSEAGFEYVAVDYATARQAMDSDSKPGGLDADQFRSEFGYGITTLYGGPDTQATIGLGRNIAIRDGLPTADRVAWERQLFGENANQTFVVGLDEEDLSRTGGCTRQAVEQNFSAAELGAGFVNYQNAEGSRIDQDPRVIAAYQDWATCMRDAGYSYSTGDEIDADLASRLDGITQGMTPADLPEDAQAALTQLQGEERAIAAADHDCELKHVADIKTKVELEILGPDAGA